MSTITARRRSTRVTRLIGGAVAATVAALAVALSAVPASADPTDITSGHIDFVSVNVNDDATALTLGSNYEDTKWVPAGTYELVVPQTTFGGETGYIIPETQSEASSRGVPWAGFSGDEALSGVGFTADDEVTLTLTNVAFTPKPGTSGHGTVALSQNGTPWFTNAEGHAHTFVTDGAEEVFHQHVKWVFSAPGTYVLTFSASSDLGLDASPATYTIKVGL
ncbi:MAG TPA: choice-of-anchor M domain-containing protein [Marmoricola sp.]